MKRIVCLLLGLCLLAGGTLAQGEDEVPGGEWTYPLDRALIGDENALIRLANREALLTQDDDPRDLVKITVQKTSSTAIEMRQEAAQALADMFEAALGDGVKLYAHSGYRSYQTQKTMYFSRLEANNGKDDKAVAYPGASDHQTGLGIDVISKDWIGKRFNSDFAKTKEAAWMAEHCWEYGFVIRYPLGKEAITDIIYEPWHLRYVGREVAAYMTFSALTLEEFDGQWRQVLADYKATGGA